MQWHIQSRQWKQGPWCSILQPLSLKPQRKSPPGDDLWQWWMLQLTLHFCIMLLKVQRCLQHLSHRVSQCSDVGSFLLLPQLLRSPAQGLSKGAGGQGCEGGAPGVEKVIKRRKSDTPTKRLMMAEFWVAWQRTWLLGLVSCSETHGFVVPLAMFSCCKWLLHRNCFLQGMKVDGRPEQGYLLSHLFGLSSRALRQQCVGPVIREPVYFNPPHETQK